MRRQKNQNGIKQTLRCKNYVGVTCVNGNCPRVNIEEYEERYIPLISSCEDCFYYEGCEDCALDGTEHCVGNAGHNLALN